MWGGMLGAHGDAANLAAVAVSQWRTASPCPLAQRGGGGITLLQG